ncbi:VOC family protein [Pontibacter sp. HJ8]
MPLAFHDSLGVRHICFHAVSRAVVDQVGEWLKNRKGDLLRGPQEMPLYSVSYYTVDFRDPNGFVLEVAHTPDIKL